MKAPFLWLLVVCGVLCFACAEDVGDECDADSSDSPGVCSLVIKCPEAVMSVRRRGHHDFKRCGFEGEIEVVCCPFGSAGRIDESTTTTEPPRRPTRPTPTRPTPTRPTPTQPPRPQPPLRRSDRECQQLTKTIPPPLGLHILGGEEASNGEFPHMAALGYEKDNSIDFQCGGSLISPRYVLTAAHCVVTLERIEPSITRLGVVALGRQQFDPETDYRIDNIVNHPEYGRPQKYHDLSLLRLEKPVELTSTMHPACLHSSREDPDGDLIITGWGAVSGTRSTRSNVLLKANVTAVPTARCRESYNNQRNLPQGITADQLCAGDSEGKRDTCQGDSGGPLQLLTPNDGMYRLVGVTSFGRGCGSAIPGVYTRVANYLDWIESVVWAN